MGYELWISGKDTGMLCRPNIPHLCRGEADVLIVPPFRKVHSFTLSNTTMNDAGLLSLVPLYSTYLAGTIFSSPYWPCCQDQPRQRRHCHWCFRSKVVSSGEGWDHGVLTFRELFQSKSYTLELSVVLRNDRKASRKLKAPADFSGLNFFELSESI